MRIKILLIFTCLSLISFGSYAQKHTIGFGVGGAAFGGETSKSLTSYIEDLGVQSKLYYAFAFNDPRWQLMAKLSYIKISTEVDVYSGGQLINYSNVSEHFIGTVGLRFYFDSYTRKYLPRFGHSAPFIGAHIGGTSFTNKTNNVTFNEGDIRYINAGSANDLCFQGEIGYRYYLGEKWCLEANANFRTGTNDLWDGIKGGTEYNDWIVSLSLGFAVNL